MTVRELIKRLKDFNPDAVVTAFDPEALQHYPVSGFVFNSSEVQIQTDAFDIEINEEKL